METFRKERFFECEMRQRQGPKPAHLAISPPLVASSGPVDPSQDALGLEV